MPLALPFRMGRESSVPKCAGMAGRPYGGLRDPISSPAAGPLRHRHRSSVSGGRAGGPRRVPPPIRGSAHVRGLRPPRPAGHRDIAASRCAGPPGRSAVPGSVVDLDAARRAPTPTGVRGRLAPSALLPLPGRARPAATVQTAFQRGGARRVRFLCIHRAPRTCANAGTIPN